MSQEQPRREDDHQEPVKYGDVFDVQGELDQKAVAPKDAAQLMQAAETTMLGATPAAMQSAVAKNERDGLVSHNYVTDATGDGGISITETDMSVITESVGGQVVEQNSQRNPGMQDLSPPSHVQEAATGGSAGITIGEALEATAITAGNKPVEWSDAAAIQAAEVRATGRTNIVPGGVAAAAQSAATLNARATTDAEKTKLADILTDATSKLPSDKAATRKDAEGVTGAEMRNDPNLTTHPAGVAASVAAAARLNQTNN